MSELSHRLTAERDKEREELARMVWDSISDERRHIAVAVFPVLMSSWSKRGADGLPDYAFFAKESIKAADALLGALLDNPPQLPLCP